MSDSSEFSGIRKTSEVKIQDSTKQTERETCEYSDANETENTSVEATESTEVTESTSEEVDDAIENELYTIKKASVDHIVEDSYRSDESE